jgi:hypothetical protein
VSDGAHATDGPVWDFTTVGQTTLTVDVVGSGSVTKDPDLPAYDVGSSVELTADPDDGWEFDEWTGDAAGSDNPLTVLMTGPKTITANFRDAAAPSVLVLSPNAPDTLVVGEIETLRWTATDNVGVTGVDLLLSRSGVGGPYDPIATSVPNTGSYDWTVTAPATLTAFLKVVARDAAGNSGEDASDVAFEISAGTSGVDEVMPTVFALAMKSSNPLRHGGLFSFAVPRTATVRVAIHDVQGREVAVLADGLYRPGWHNAFWNGRGRHGRSPAGVYFLRMDAPGKTLTRTIVLAR